MIDTMGLKREMPMRVSTAGKRIIRYCAIRPHRQQARFARFRQAAVLLLIGVTVPAAATVLQNFAQSAINRRRLSNSVPRA